LFGSIQKFRGATWDDEGQALVEYSLVLLLVALVAIPMLSAIGGDLAAKFDSVAGAL
jgi:Flp pilus assembly pilin Flp